MFYVQIIEVIHSDTSEVEYVPFVRLKSQGGGINCSTRMEMGIPVLGCTPCVFTLRLLSFCSSFKRRALFWASCSPGSQALLQEEGADGLNPYYEVEDKIPCISGDCSSPVAVGRKGECCCFCAVS